MAEAASPAAAPLRQSDAQWRAALFGDPAQRLHAVLRGRRLQGLPEQLAQAGVRELDCLQPGALSARESARASWLVHLPAAEAFTDWVLGPARGVAADFGALILSRARFAVLRTHLRELSRAVQADGQAFTLDWPDPIVLGHLLPLLDGTQLRRVFEQVEQFVLPAPGGWRHHRLVLGRLEVRAVDLLELALA